MNIAPEIMARFWDLVTPDGPLPDQSKHFYKGLRECWLFKGRTKGYNMFSYKSFKISAHRFSCILVNGELQPGEIVCHRCDNPFCVNPEHLFAGSPADNALDCVAKGRANKNPRLVLYDETNLPENHPANPSPALRTLIRESGLSIPEIAVKSGVNERSLRRWFYEHTVKLNFVSAGLVYHLLTGKPIIAAAGKPIIAAAGKPGRKGKAAA